MKIIIDTDKKIVEVPKAMKEAHEYQLKVDKMLGKESSSILSQLDLRDYKVISKHINTRVGDKTTAKDIDNFMKKIKDSQKDLYEEYIELKEKVVKTTAKGTKVKTNFLNIKKWFYEKFPDQDPNKKN